METIFSLLGERLRLGRRLAAGLIVIATVAVAYLWGEADPKLGVIANYMKNAAPVAGLIFLAYFVGVFVEVLGEYLVARLAGAAVWAAKFPGRKVQWLPTVPRFIIRVCLWALMPMIYYYYVCRAVSGRDDFHFEAQEILSPRGKAAFVLLPDSVQTGLLKPFSDHHRHAWYELTVKVSDQAKIALNDEQDRVIDVLTLATTLLFVVTIAVFILPPSLLGVSIDETKTVASGISMDAHVSVPPERLAEAIAFLPFVVVLCSYFYMRRLRESTVTAVEIYASELPPDAGKVAALAPQVEPTSILVDAGRVFWRVFLWLAAVDALVSYLAWNLGPNVLVADLRPPMMKLMTLELLLPIAGFLSGHSFLLGLIIGGLSSFYLPILVLVAFYGASPLRWPTRTSLVIILGSLAGELIGLPIGASLNGVWQAQGFQNLLILVPQIGQMAGIACGVSFFIWGCERRNPVVWKNICLFLLTVFTVRFVGLMISDILNESIVDNTLALFATQVEAMVVWWWALATGMYVVLKLTGRTIALNNWKVPIGLVVPGVAIPAMWMSVSFFKAANLMLANPVDFAVGDWIVDAAGASAIWFVLASSGSLRSVLPNSHSNC